MQVGVSGGMKTKKADLGERSTFYFDDKVSRSPPLPFVSRAQALQRHHRM